MLQRMRNVVTVFKAFSKIFFSICTMSQNLNNAVRIPLNVTRTTSKHTRYKGQVRGWKRLTRFSFYGVKRLTVIFSLLLALPIMEVKTVETKTGRHLDKSCNEGIK